jgi:hypothetical protein
MRVDRMVKALAGLVLALSSAFHPALAHHSTNAEYDRTQSLTLAGTIVAVQWTNPHVWIVLDIGTPGAPQLWSIEAQAPARLRLWDLRLTAGERIEVRVLPSRTGDATGFLRVVRLADGSIACPAVPPDSERDCDF